MTLGVVVFTTLRPPTYTLLSYHNISIQHTADLRHSSVQVVVRHKAFHLKDET